VRKDRDDFRVKKIMYLGTIHICYIVNLQS
jgi:hypothetical protein